jgi:hypothetical protein
VIRTMPHFTINHWMFQGLRRFGHLCLIHRQLTFRLRNNIMVNHKLQWTRIGPLMIVNGNTASMPFIANLVVGIMRGVGNWLSCRTGIAASKCHAHRWVLDCRFSKSRLLVWWRVITKKSNDFLKVYRMSKIPLFDGSPANLTKNLTSHIPLFQLPVVVVPSDQPVR